MREKGRNCEFRSCRKSITKATWYYRDGFYFCSKSHWRQWKKERENKKKES